jgi:hypothetical protein
VAVVLIVAGCAGAGVGAGGVDGEPGLYTGRYVANMAPLIEDLAIQNVLADKLTHQIVTQIDVIRPSAQAAAELSHKGVPRIGGLGAGRGDLRLLGPPDRRGDHRDRRPAAGRARPHRTDRQAPTATRAHTASHQ